MNDAIMMGSVAEELMDFVSTTPARDSNYSIACEMLRHYPKLKGMSLGEMAELCFVSKASISRFCRFMGFDSFKEFSEYLQMEYSIGYDYSRPFYTSLLRDPEKTLTDHCDAIVQNLQATGNAENYAKLPQIATQMYHSHRLAYFSHHFLWDVGRQFQSKMMRMNRYVERYLDYGPQLTCARSLQKGDMAIVCSIGGSYPLRHANIWNALTASGCTLVVITQNYANSCWNSADFLLSCGSSNQNDVGKYAALLAVEMLALTYLRQYGKEFF